MSTRYDGRRDEAMATLTAAVWACGDVVPYEQRDARVRLEQDKADRNRHWVHLCGRKVGWLYKTDSRPVEWRAYLCTGDAHGHEPRGYDPSRRRHALADLLHEAFLVAGRGYF